MANYVRVGRSGVGCPSDREEHTYFRDRREPFEEVDPDCKDFKKAFINAHILERTGEEVSFNEGCLSIPGIHEDVIRKDRIKIAYRDENWVEHVEEFTGTRARIVQHEYDHLDGVMFTDHLSALKKRLLKGKLSNISAGKFKQNYRVILPKLK